MQKGGRFDFFRPFYLMFPYITIAKNTSSPLNYIGNQTFVFYN